MVSACLLNKVRVLDIVAELREQELIASACFPLLNRINAGLLSKLGPFSHVHNPANRADNVRQFLGGQLNRNCLHDRSVA